MLEWLAGAFARLVQNIFVVGQDVVMWFWNGCLTLLNLALESLTLPTLPSASYFTNMWSSVTPWMAQANQWVPVTEGVTMLTVYVGFYIAWIPVRIALRHLPFIGR